jgi:hypothetical protein
MMVIYSAISMLQFIKFGRAYSNRYSYLKVTEVNNLQIHLLTLNHISLYGTKFKEINAGTAILESCF